MNYFEKKQGESLAFTKGLLIDGVAQDFTTGWTCRMQVKSKQGGLSSLPLIDKAISELNTDSDRFVCRITPAEMAGLSEGKYTVITELENTTLGVNKEIHDRLIVQQQGIS